MKVLFLLTLLIIVSLGRKYSTHQYIRQQLNQQAQEIKQTYVQELSRSLRALYEIFFDTKKTKKKYTPQVDLSHDQRKPNEPLFVHVKESNLYLNGPTPRSLGEVEELRSLQQCANGLSYSSDITIYYCNTTRVTKTEYDKQTNIDPARCSTQTQTNQKLCICPRDYYGALCDQQAPIYCYPELVWPDISKCREGKEDTQFYSYSIPGDDPCIFVQEDGIQILRFRTICTSPYWAKEEIDTEDLFTVNNPPSGPYSFTYYVNNTDLAMSNFIETTVKLLRFDFFAFVWEELIYSLKSPSQFTGASNYEFTLDMEVEKEKKHIAGGRLYFEVFHSSNPSAAVVTEVQPGFVDIEGYDPGTKDYNKLTGGQIAAIVISVLVVVAIIVIIVVCCIKNKRKRIKTHAD